MRGMGSQALDPFRQLTSFLLPCEKYRCLPDGPAGRPYRSLLASPASNPFNNRRGIAPTQRLSLCDSSGIGTAPRNDRRRYSRRRQTAVRRISGSARSTSRCDMAPLQVVPAAASCSTCYAYRTGPYTFRGNRLCCNRVCGPISGCTNYCWVESCNPFAGGGILV